MRGDCFIIIWLQKHVAFQDGFVIMEFPTDELAAWVCAKSVTLTCGNRPPLRPRPGLFVRVIHRVTPSSGAVPIDRIRVVWCSFGAFFGASTNTMNLLVGSR